ncbi:hypothetical protein BDZ94DRAFT_620014 [Collybia nuda]|uniref:Uncharacterized protein n=1 Tax=Collybia nuda TaxID=64659 RepID=A0A9P5Y8Y2_9AGAR|nr:hypothetical protein BDZ94DRAFT_620014 [Collybia nuda]
MQHIVSAKSSSVQPESPAGHTVGRNPYCIRVSALPPSRRTIDSFRKSPSPFYEPSEYTKVGLFAHMDERGLIIHKV